MTWQTQTLGEICDEGGGEVRTGPFGSQLHESDYSEMGTPVVMPKDIIEGRVSERTVARIADEHVNRLAQHQLRTGDIVYGRRGDIGRQALITPRESGWLCGTGCLRITPGESRVDSTYLHYYLRDAKVIEGIAQQAIGATMPNLNTTILRGIQVRFPPASEQKRIASILSAYDDLIENNTRRIAIVEEMARRIYEEWFVRFRFPGHEGVRMVESELGLVPEGWPIVRLDDVLVLQRGFDLPKQDRTEGPFPIISASGTSATHHECKVKGPGVVTGRSGSLGTVMYVEGDFWPLNTTLWVKKFAAGSPLYAFYVLQSIDLVGFNSGAAVPTLNRNDVHGLPVVRPTPDVLGAFDEVVGPMIRLKRRLELANENLRTTRDFLLPKLISGELDVSAVPEPEALAA